MAYTDIDDPTLFFRTVTYTGDGNSSKAITFDETDTSMQPDVVWIKNRTDAHWHNMNTSTLGVGAANVIRPNLASSKGGTSGHVSSLDSNGFTVAEGSSNAEEVNTNNDNYVAWCFKSGTSFSNDASATSIGDIDSSGTVSTTAGFSTFKATSDANADKDIAHGLGTVPDVIWARNTAQNYNWDCYYKSLGYNASLKLNESDATRTGAWGSNTFTTTTFEGKHDYSIAQVEYLYLAWSNRQGFFKSGKYKGNGSSTNSGSAIDGQFVYTGFRPAWVLWKNHSNAGGHWVVVDNKRNPTNITTPGTSGLSHLQPNLANAESASEAHVDIVSNGFKFRSSSNNNFNYTGQTYIWMAIAEAPLVNSNGVPCNAR